MTIQKPKLPPGPGTIGVAKPEVVLPKVQEKTAGVAEQSFGERGAYGSASAAVDQRRTKAADTVGLRTAGASEKPLVVHFSVSDEDRPIMEKSKLAGYRNVIVSEPLTAQNAHLAEKAQVITTFVHDKVGPDVLAQLPNLQVIAQRATGFDNIDLGAAAKRDVKVFNVPEYGSHTVAEYAFALLLAVTRHVEHAYERTEKGDFRITGLMGHDLHGKRMVIVGAGGIGMAAVEIARGFGMNVVVVNPKQDPEAALRLGFRYDTMENAFGQADYISLHVPLNEHTEHLIDAEALSNVKKGAILVNTARGPVVDTQALIDALESGQIAAAGLDCFEGEKKLIGTDDKLAEEPLIDALRKRDDVILTPHVAFDSAEAVGRIMDTTAANIEGARWGNAENRVGSMGPELRPLAAGLRELSARLQGWFGDRKFSMEVRKPIGAELSAAWGALEQADHDGFRDALERLAARTKGLGADTTTQYAITKLAGEAPS